MLVSTSIVLVHANGAIRAAIESLLHEAGWQHIHGVPNGGEAVRVALAVLPQMVLLDPYLQGMDSLATIVALRAHGIRAPVVALVERNDQLQCLWKEHGFAGAIALLDGLSQFVPQIQALLAHPEQE